MTVVWECRCGWRGDVGHSAFLHRDGSFDHNPKPTIKREPRGIDKESLIDISTIRRVHA
jgi:hypothetical protein